jgi:hypothetical protein
MMLFCIFLNNILLIRVPTFQKSLAVYDAKTTFDESSVARISQVHVEGTLECY